MKILWDISQLSGISNVKPETIYNWMCKSRIPNIKLRRLVRFDPDDIEKWLDDNKHSVSPKNHNLLIVDFAPMFVIILHVIKTRRNR
jgi:predicted DNA-binding transcriptional regulator AlpA